MAEAEESSTNCQQGRATKRLKLAGCDSYGKIPNVFVDGKNNNVKMEFHIHDFPNLPQKRGENFLQVPSTPMVVSGSCRFSH